MKKNVVEATLSRNSETSLQQNGYPAVRVERGDDPFLFFPFISSLSISKKSQSDLTMIESAYALGS